MARRGPRPVLLHLGLAAMRSSASSAASPSWKNVWPQWNAVADLADHGLANDTRSRPPIWDSNLVAGIASYRRHPYARDLADPPTIWSEGETRLLDFGGTGPTILFVPSLINRAYVLDLAEEASFTRYLASKGTRPLLLDWGWPGPVERQFTLADYISGRLERALHAINEPVILAGFCMGGILALATALRRPARVRALALFATPWDFHASKAASGIDLTRLLLTLEPVLRTTGTLPIDLLQVLFTMLDPFGVGDKYRKFSALAQKSPQARRFVALEDWLNDGVPLAEHVARETLEQWYGVNAPGRGEWCVEGHCIDPTTLPCRTFIAIPKRDLIVPPASALPLATLIPNTILIRPDAGHIGMVAGMHAESALWKPFLRWIRGL